MKSNKYPRNFREGKPIMYDGWAMYGGTVMERKSQLYGGASMYGGSTMCVRTRLLTDR